MQTVHFFGVVTKGMDFVDTRWCYAPEKARYFVFRSLTLLSVLETDFYNRNFDISIEIVVWSAVEMFCEFAVIWAVFCVPTVFAEAGFDGFSCVPHIDEVAYFATSSVHNIFT